VLKKINVLLVNRLGETGFHSCCDIVGAFAKVDEQSDTIFNDWVFAVCWRRKIFDSNRATITIGEGVGAHDLLNRARDITVGWERVVHNPSAF
jgi:hypothetical protein